MDLPRKKIFYYDGEIYDFKRKKVRMTMKKLNNGQMRNCKTMLQGS